jgi:hypothetical protein
MTWDVSYVKPLLSYLFYVFSCSISLPVRLGLSGSEAMYEMQSCKMQNATMQKCRNEMQKMYQHRQVLLVHVKPIILHRYIDLAGCRHSQGSTSEISLRKTSGNAGKMSRGTIVYQNQPLNTSGVSLLWPAQVARFTGQIIGLACQGCHIP